jgi:hypothetical protein
MLSPPGVGKSDAVRQAAAEAGLECGGWHGIPLTAAELMIIW